MGCNNNNGVALFHLIFFQTTSPASMRKVHSPRNFFFLNLFSATLDLKIIAHIYCWGSTSIVIITSSSPVSGTASANFSGAIA